jgi:two-component system CheB/CheR fusion protein
MDNGKLKSANSRNEYFLNDNNSDQFPIIGIGASAGGLEALEQFFQNLPGNCGMAFVIVQHLDPKHIGYMPELLQRTTSMKVYQVTDRLKVKPGVIYIIPPNKSMSILKGTLYLFDLVENGGLRLPIDFFFRSLAEDLKERSIGIILSGMGSDGTLGLKAIKEMNGLVLVQDSHTAKYDSMPRSATEAVIADIIAPVADLPSKLISLLKFKPAVETDKQIDSKYKSNLEKIIILLRERSGHDFSLYKKKTLLRRIERRKSVHQIDKIDNYVRFLQVNPKEVEILFKELLIGVTSFFRDTAVWESLKENFLPDLIKKIPDGHILRAWVAGCSTGEEAYSLAIILIEILEKVSKNKKILFQIFATDLDHDAIEFARKGIYSANIVSDVSSERLSRFFSGESGGYRVNPALREMIVFAPQNITKDPPFTKLEILSCRNLLIYIEPEMQKKLLTLFHYSLKPDGILMLGTSETTGVKNKAFTELSSKLKIFKRTGANPLGDLDDFPDSFYRNKHFKPTEVLSPRPVENIQSLADQVLLQQFSPPGVLVNEKGDIIYITGRTGKYLEPVAGKANWNIYAMLCEGLRNELPAAFRRAMQNFDPVILRNLKTVTDGGTQYVNITLRRIEKPEQIRGMIMVVFADGQAKNEQIKENPKTEKQGSTGRLRESEDELRRCSEELQSTREEMQTSHEELKSTNEELQSINEELQSTNEELTTSREEMQSLNEELQTVNIELQNKVSDYQQSDDDMKNLLNSTEIATLFLDRDLNIRRYTDQVSSLINIRKTDIGRPFTDLTTDLKYADLSKHALQVIKTLIFVETAITTNDGRWFNVRIMPYRTVDDRIAGLVITFSDITESKKLEIELKKANEALRNSGIRTP